MPEASRRGPLTLADIPALPIDRGVPVPQGHPHAPTAALSVRLHDLTVTAEGPVGEAEQHPPRHGHSGFRFALPPLRLSGRCTVDSRPDSPQELDTAGDLGVGAVERAAKAEEEPVPEERQEWLRNARRQRDRLVKSGENGYRLVSTFYEHNEIYNEAFQTKALQTCWLAGGATEQMARDTHEAVADGRQPVNRGDKFYSRNDSQPPVTYNSNAFTQKLAVIEAVKLRGQRDPLGNPQVVNPAYQKAANAADEFGKAVEDTGNKKNEIQPLTAQQIYEHVASAGTAAAAPPLDDDPGRAAAVPEQLDEEDLRFVTSFRAALLREWAEERAFGGVPLYQAGLTAHVQGATAEVDLERDPRSGRQVVVLHIPEWHFTLEGDDWPDEAGRIARERIGGMQFLQVLLSDALVAQARAAILDGHPDLVPAAITDQER